VCIIGVMRSDAGLARLLIAAVALLIAAALALASAAGIGAQPAAVAATVSARRRQHAPLQRRAPPSPPPPGFPSSFAQGFDTPLSLRPRQRVLAQLFEQFGRQTAACVCDTARFAVTDTLGRRGAAVAVGKAEALFDNPWQLDRCRRAAAQLLRAQQLRKRRALEQAAAVDAGGSGGSKVGRAAGASVPMLDDTLTKAEGLVTSFHEELGFAEERCVCRWSLVVMVRKGGGGGRGGGIVALIMVYFFFHFFFCPTHHPAFPTTNLSPFSPLHSLGHVLWLDLAPFASPAFRREIFR
jgi:hypothetical protein